MRTIIRVRHRKHDYLNAVDLCLLDRCLAKCGIQVLMSDLFGVEGTKLLDRLDLPAAYTARIGSLRRIMDDLDLMDDLDFEVEVFENLTRGRPTRLTGPAPSGMTCGNATTQ
ncbi:hypothetical protein [Nocardioides bigeumensis]|uniref:hypothetical protein n=1 Tax=Nocardioides bigeumensis TaxID=433657 RepID=UPI0031DD8550